MKGVKKPQVNPHTHKKGGMIMTKDEIKHHLAQYSYYRYMSHPEREPGKYLPLLNMVKSMLYSLPKEERRVLYLRYCLHKEVNYIADKLYRERTTIYRMEKRALQKLMQHQRNDCL